MRARTCARTRPRQILRKSARLRRAQAVEQDIVPTVGSAVETFTKDNLGFTVFDMSGQGRYRNLWEHYYPECAGIILSLIHI